MSVVIARGNREALLLPFVAAEKGGRDVLKEMIGKVEEQIELAKRRLQKSEASRE